jgi:S-formylglutathione hydrolase FrmB
MALIQCRFFSDTLGLSTSMTVIVPQNRPDGDGHPTLYLLHGNSDDDTIWLRRTSIERYADAKGLAVVMPQAHRSFYTDMASGYRYWTFLSEELPKIACSMFRLSEARERNFVAGLSMGGYGAFKWALRRPERFAAAASLSGALNMSASSSRNITEGLRADLKLIFGESGAAEREDDLLWLVRRAADTRADLPKLYQWCGTEDFLYQDNLTFRDTCRAVGIELTYEEGPGDHTWEHWDRKIRDVLDWLPLASD